MRHWILVWGLIFAYQPLFAQTDSLDIIMEKVIEAFIETTETEDFDFNTAFENLSILTVSKLNINKATENDLKQFFFLSPIQINDILNYRIAHGKFIELYELQVIPSLDVATIKMLVPFVTVSDATTIRTDYKYLIENAQHQLFLKYKRVLQTRRGYLPNANGEIPYEGNQDHYYIRYRMDAGNDLKAGFTMEKDPGEGFFSGNNPRGFDFYSAFLYVQRPIKFIKALSIGDFTTSMGQGLILFNDFAPGKSAFVMNIKRGGRALRPYSSVNETSFFRGVGATFELKDNLEATVFYSSKGIAGTIQSDTLEDDNFEFFSSLNLSGFHRTQSEIARKNSVTQRNIGAKVIWNQERLRLGFNALHYDFSIPLVRSAEGYRLFQFSGQRLTNLSVDYNYRYQNMNFFGEIARSDNGGMAQTHGLLIGLDKKMDLAINYRKFDVDYHVLEANAFAESTLPANEEGMYLGLEVRPNNRWKIASYVDFWKNPWLRFRVDAPGGGREALLRVDYTERRKLNVYMQYRFEQKSQNTSDPDRRIDAVEDITLHRLRFQANFKINKEFEWRSRIEGSLFIKEGARSYGTILAQDLFYKPEGKSYSMNARYAIFDVDRFENRIYTFESDLLYEFAIPFFQHRGSRFYVNFRKRLSRTITWESRFSTTFLSNQDVFGSGNEQIAGPSRSELKTQIRMRF